MIQVQVIKVNIKLEILMMKKMNLKFNNNRMFLKKRGY